MKPLDELKRRNKGRYMPATATEVWPANIPSGFDLDFIKTIFDLRTFFFPVTQRKMIFFLLYLSLIGMLVWLEYTVNLSKKVVWALNQNVLWLTVITYGMEPFMLALYMILARYPYFDPKKQINNMRNLEEGCIDFNQDTVLVIPCHHSASSAFEIQSLRKVITSALVHFLPSHIIVVDNGAEEKPADNTKEIIQSIHSDIIYIYRHCDGNKNRAQLNGVELAITRYGHQIKYVLLIDDDVQIPEHYNVEHAFFLDKHVRGIIYPILATSSHQKDILLTRWQNIEYQLSDLTLSALDAFQVAPAPHGACVLLEIKTAQRILQQHTGRFKGEDKEIGAILYNLYDIDGTLKLRVDMAVHFKTVVPSSYLGHGDNLWKQRVRSWSEAPYLYGWSLVLKPLLADWRFPLESLPMIKLTQSYYLLSQCSHIFRYYIIALEAKNPKFWLTFAIFSLVQLSVILLFNYQKLPSYLRNDFISTVTFPIYKNIDNAMSHFAFWRAILFSIPAEPKARANLRKLESGAIPQLQINYNADENKSSIRDKTKAVHSTSKANAPLRQSRSYSRISTPDKTPLQKLSLYRAGSAPEAKHERPTKARPFF